MEQRIDISRILDKVDSLFNKNDYAEAGRLLKYWKNEAVTQGDKRSELTLENELICYYRKQNEIENGLASVRRATKLLYELSQMRSATGATVLLNCATAYNAFGLSEEGLPLYLQAEEIYKEVLLNDDTRFGGLYNNMALTYADLKMYDKAENAYFKALEIMQKHENGKPECAITYVNLAHLYELRSEQEKIDLCLKKAYELLVDKSVVRNGYLAFVLEKCAPSFAHFGDKATCEKFLKEAKTLYEGA